MFVRAVDRPELEPFSMPARFVRDVGYFMTPAGEPGVPTLSAGEYWIRQSDIQRWLDDGVLILISPLDSQHTAEVELSDEQQSWLEWMQKNGIQHVRLEV